MAVNGRHAGTKKKPQLGPRKKMFHRPNFAQNSKFSPRQSARAATLTNAEFPQIPFELLEILFRWQSEIYSVRNWSLEMPQEPSSRPNLVLDRISGSIGTRFLSSTGLGFGTPRERERERANPPSTSIGCWFAPPSCR